MDLQQSAAIGLSRALVDMATKDQRIDELETQVMMLTAALQNVITQLEPGGVISAETLYMVAETLDWSEG